MQPSGYSSWQYHKQHQTNGLSSDTICRIQPRFSKEKTYDSGTLGDAHYPAGRTSIESRMGLTFSLKEHTLSSQ
ncbi:MAG TPA: hypothetical protein DCF63_13845 [Planctomycetaceae bacterium]|nr:hypothetical protein [Planctomycetaceae bacterium]